MPEIVNLPGRTPPPRKRRGRDLAAVLAAEAAAPTPRPITGMSSQLHMAYAPHGYREEYARNLNPRARQIVGVGPFMGYYSATH